MTFTDTVENVARAFDGLGVLVLVVGMFWSAVVATRRWRRSGDGRQAYVTLRESFGGVLLLGLEILVAGDLIRTVAVAPTLANVIVLALIVLIRTFLSFSLQVEIDGVAPWRRSAITGRTPTTAVRAAPPS